MPGCTSHTNVVPLHSRAKILPDIPRGGPRHAGESGTPAVGPPGRPSSGPTSSAPGAPPGPCRPRRGAATPPHLQSFCLHLRRPRLRPRAPPGESLGRTGPPSPITSQIPKSRKNQAGYAWCEGGGGGVVTAEVMKRLTHQTSLFRSCRKPPKNRREDTNRLVPGPG